MEDYPFFPSTTSPTQSDHDNHSPSTHSGSVTSDSQETLVASLGSTTFHSATESSFLSPLENSTTRVERSIIGLSLGGDTLGWQTETPTPWQSEHPTPTKLAQSDEDSDDDKPIMQMLKHHDQDDSTPVSVHTLCPIHCSFVLRRHLRKQSEMIKESNLYS
jgi:sorting nexin-1/2